MIPRLIALHGFLGEAADWDRLAADLAGVKVKAIDLWRVFRDPGVRDWESAMASLDAALAECLAATRAGGETFVVGYSLGARLALGSRLLWSPASRVRGCCLVSCNPGLADDDGDRRAARRAADAAWALRLLEDAPDVFWSAWDSQPVFAGSRVPPNRRRDLPAPRELLARALTATSLAEQPDLRPRLRTWPASVLWVTGGRDTKFAAIARELEEDGVPAEFVGFDEAGHRVPWDNPPAFAALIQEWIAQGVRRAGEAERQR